MQGRGHGFVDLWSSFVAKDEMYMRDGLHLSGKGAGYFYRRLETGSKQWIGKRTLFKLVGQGDWQSKLKLDKRIAVPI